MVVCGAFGRSDEEAPGVDAVSCWTVTLTGQVRILRVGEPDMPVAKSDRADTSEYKELVGR